MAEAIKGVVLNDLVAGVENDLVQSQVAQAKRAIHGIYADIVKWNQERAAAQRKVEELDDRIQKAVQKLARLKNNDWSALPDLKPPKDEQN